MGWGGEHSSHDLGWPMTVFLAGLKVVCHIALTIWSYWHECREQIF